VQKLVARRGLSFDQAFKPIDKRASIFLPQPTGATRMSAVQRHAEAAEEMRFDLMKIATETGAIKTDEEGEHFVSCYRADAERHAYALATIRCKRHVWDANIREVDETLKDILDEARYGDRFKDRWTPTYT
jgi:hypothetical protein